MKVVIIGKDEMLANLIEGAVLSGSKVIGVLRYENLYKNKFQLFLNDNFKTSCVLPLIKKYKIKDLRYKSANSEEFRKFLLHNNVDILLIGTWAEKIDKATFVIPKIATINVHPSLLPKYRGPNPYLQTIWKQENYSGISFHLVTEKYDAGAILAQSKISILENDTGKELRTRTTAYAKIIASELLTKLQTSVIEPTEQNERDATYYKDINPEDMTLDFKKETAAEIYAHIRGFYPFRPTYIDDGNRFWIVNPYHVKTDNGIGKPNEIKKYNKNSLSIACKDGIRLKFSRLKKYNKIQRFFY